MMQKILTWSILYYLRFWAKLALKKNKPTVIGITGSIGKTSCRNAVYAVLKDNFPTKAIEKGNSETGIPLGILGLKVHSLGYQTPLQSIFDWLGLIVRAPLSLNYLKGTKYLVIEMGIDEPTAPKNMEFLLTIVQPDISIFLNVHPVHAVQFEQTIPSLLQQKSLSIKEKRELILKNIAQEKGKIITKNPNCKVAIYNQDNEYVKEVVENFQKTTPNMKFLTFGKDSQNNLVSKNFDISLLGTIFSFNLKGKEKENLIVLRFKKYLLPEAYEEALGGAILVGKAAGISANHIEEGLINHFTLPPGRASIFTGVNETLIIDSSYNASKKSMLAFLELVALLKADVKRPVIFLMGDMRELGEAAKEEHEEVAKSIIGTVDRLYCVGPLTKQYIVPMFEGKLDEVKWFENPKKAGDYLSEHLPRKAIVLVKGSQNTIFLEEAVKQILQDKTEAKLLCRQDPSWMRKKEYLYEN